MTFGDFKTLAKGMKTIYTNDGFLPNENALKIWYSLLGDIPYEVLNIAIQKYVVSNKFPPTIADLRGIVAEITSEDNNEWGDAWGEVVRAIQEYGRYDVKGALNSMSSRTRRVVKCMGFETLCDSDNLSVERANFRMLYENMKSKDEAERRLPTGIREQVAKITDSGMKKLTEVSNE